MNSADNCKSKINEMQSCFQEVHTLMKKRIIYISNIWYYIFNLNNLNYDIVISATKDVEHCGGQVNLSTAKRKTTKTK